MSEESKPSSTSGEEAAYNVDEARSRVWTGSLIGLASLFLVLFSEGAKASASRDMIGGLYILAGIGMFGFIAAVLLFYEGFQALSPLDRKFYRVARTAALIQMAGAFLYALYYIFYGSAYMGASGSLFNASAVLLSLATPILALGAAGVGIGLKRSGQPLRLAGEAELAGIFYALMGVPIIGEALAFIGLSIMFFAYKPSLPSPEILARMPTAPPPEES